LLPPPPDPPPQPPAQKRKIGRYTNNESITISGYPGPPSGSPEVYIGISFNSSHRAEYKYKF